MGYPPMGELFSQIQEVFLNLFNSQALMATLAKPEMTVAAFVALNLVVFIETGLFCFLPGDSLLVTAGLVAWNTGWNLPLLIGTLCAAAIAGDSVGYAIGFQTGPRIFSREKSLLFLSPAIVAWVRAKCRKKTPTGGAKLAA